DGFGVRRRRPVGGRLAERDDAAGRSGGVRRLVDRAAGPAGTAVPTVATLGRGLIAVALVLLNRQRDVAAGLRCGVPGAGGVAVVLGDRGGIPRVEAVGVGVGGRLVAAAELAGAAAARKRGRGDDDHEREHRDQANQPPDLGIQRFVLSSVFSITWVLLRRGPKSPRRR